MGTLISLLVLSLLIFFHELGHFVAARFFNVTVHVFSIGFGKKLYSFKIGSTQWQIAAIPLGGYVRMKGQDDLDPLARNNQNDSYNAKPPWQRIIILLAGPFANFALAFVLFFAVGTMGSISYEPIIGKVQEKSPAQLAGIKAGDKIIEINSKQILSWRDISTHIKDSNGAIEFIVERDDLLYPIVVEPQMLEAQTIFKEKIHKRMVGISASGKTFTQTYNPIESLSFAYERTVDASLLIVKSIQKLIEGVVPTKELGGVVSIVQITSQASQSGIVALFLFSALISVNLGVLNLLPIPALDGGHIMFNIYEIFRGKPPSEKVLIQLTIAGWVILFSLMGLGLYNDFTRIFSNG